MEDTTHINITIDGTDIVSEAGKTILEIARENQIEIPTLCFDPRLKPIGSCLLCVVEVEGSEKLLLSCATEARDKMIVQTNNENVSRARKNALELLLSNHFADCIGPCIESCPAGVDIQGYLALSKAGNYLDALELIQQKNPFPLVCGRVCVRYCELSCRRQEKESPVGINLVKRFLADLEYQNLRKPVVSKIIDKKVAIIGGGPCGLTAAYFLARKGYWVQIFDSQPKLGGMLRYGIPDYRLPQEILDREIQFILDHGIKVQTDMKLGVDFQLDELKENGFEAFFLAIGAQKAKKMNIKKEHIRGVIGGIGFLEVVKKEGPPDLKGTVVVVGGGNTAIDAARTAIRCKASKVLLLYRRTREEMPADKEEIEDALAEGVTFKFLTAPLEVIVKNGRVQSLRCQRMELGEPDESGRRRPVPVEGDQFNTVCNHIIAAIGQDCDPSGLGSSFDKDVELSRWNTIKVQDQTTLTSVPGIFAGGDAVTGPAAAIDAIGMGRKAALEIDRYLKKTRNEPVREAFFSKKTNLGEIPISFFDEFENRTRSSRRVTDPVLRINDFNEIDPGIDQGCVQGEASRCLSCGCSELLTCDLKKYATEYEADQNRYLGKVQKYKIDNRHPLILLDPNKCILCGKCVRICEEWLGVSALGFINRGYDMMVRPSQERPLQETACIACGNCIEVCPTGAISFHQELERFQHYPMSAHPTVCSICSVGCEIVINKKNSDFWNITAARSSEFIPGDICGRGRFEPRQAIKENRLTAPMVVEKGDRKQTNMASAIYRAIEGLKKVHRQYGPEQLGFFISPRSTNEEIFMVQKLARQYFQCGNVATISDLIHPKDTVGLEASFGSSASTITQSEVENADIIVIMNSNLFEENPVLGFKVKRAINRGTELIAISSTETELNSYAGMWLNPRRGTNTKLINAVSAEIVRRGDYQQERLAGSTTGFGQFLESLRMSAGNADTECGVDQSSISKVADAITNPENRVIFIYNQDSYLEKAAGDLEALAHLMILSGKIAAEGSGILLCSENCNNQGYIDLGRVPKTLSSAVDMRNSLINRGFKGIFLLGEDLADFRDYEDIIEQADFVVAINNKETESTRLADVALPGSVLAESDGSITSLDRCVRSFSKVFDPPSGMTTLSILSAMHSLVSSDQSPTIEEIRRQIAEFNPLYQKLGTISQGGSFFWNENREGGNRLYASGFLTESGQAEFTEGAANSLNHSVMIPALVKSHWHDLKNKSSYGEMANGKKGK
ncbi:MAG: FAD-dependent oxidoreductase [Deltaproteobacteria bacterium]|nr:FAD-dependent oxidoreductase [Deltaproteobacteria bacterium]